MMRALLLISLAAVPIVTAQSPAGGPAERLIGRWRSAETSQGGIGAVYQFRADGTLDFSPGAIVDMSYEMDGDQLIFPPATTTGPKIKSTLIWSGDRALRLTSEGRVAEYQRQGAILDSRQPLLGEWLGSREMNGRRMAEQMFFYPAGRALLVILFSTQHGRYSVTERRLMAEFAGQVGLDGTFEIANGVLSITRSRGRVTKLARY